MDQKWINNKEDVVQDKISLMVEDDERLTVAARNCHN